MFKRIIIASETSPYTLNVVQCLQGMRKLGAEECLLLQCILPENQTLASSTTVASEENLKQQQEMLTKQGYKVETRKVTGNIGNEINRIAAEENYSVIVAGVPEFTMMGEVPYTGVAYEVIHRAVTPVLLVRISDNPDLVPNCSAEGYSIINHILFPTDFSENAGLAFEYVKKMVAEGAGKVTLAHVQDQARINILDTMEENAESVILPPQSLENSDVLNSPKVTAKSIIVPPQTVDKTDALNTPEVIAESEILSSLRIERFNKIDTERLEGMKKELQEARAAEVDINLLYGSPSVEILKIITEQKIPLVVMGSQGRGFVREFFLGSVSNNITRHSLASVLLIPAKR